MTIERILVVDDDPRIGRLARRVAEGMGIDTTVIDDPAMFESAYYSAEPQAILLDLNMAGRDGVELLRFLSDIGSQSVVILMSGMDDRIIASSRHLGVSLGLDMGPSMPKPIELALLRELLDGLDKRAERIADVSPMIEVSALEEAITGGQILPYYQPQVEIPEMAIVGFEVLARWQHPTLGLVPPVEFIGLAESTDLIASLTLAVMERGLQDLMFLESIQPNCRLSFNLSARMLNELDLPERIADVLESYGVSAERIVMEVTESGRIAELPRGIDILTRLRLRGVGLSNDDLGKGYASVDQLYRLPYSELKVDKDFVSAALHDRTARAIVESTIGLGKRMKMRVVAEGVEDVNILPDLLSMGCDIVQGNGICPASPLREVLSWAENWRKMHGAS